MSTVDEILASGQYRDRRGRRWEHQASLNWDEDEGHYRTEEVGWCQMRGLSLVGEIITHAQMRLLIERDMHRDECKGLDSCTSHPVPHVLAGRAHARVFKVVGRHFETRYGATLPEAMDAARALAVTP